MAEKTRSAFISRKLGLFAFVSFIMDLSIDVYHSFVVPYMNRALRAMLALLSCLALAGCGITGNRMPAGLAGLAGSDLHGLVRSCVTRRFPMPGDSSASPLPAKGIEVDRIEFQAPGQPSYRRVLQEEEEVSTFEWRGHRLMRTIERTGSGGEWTTEYRCAPRSYTTSSLKTAGKDTGWGFIRRLRYDGRLLESWEVPAGGERRRTETWRYDLRGRELERDYFTGGDLYSVSRFTWGNGREPVEEWINYPSGSSTDKTLIRRRDFDARGNTVREVLTGSESGVIYSATFQYDPQNRLTLQHQAFADGAFFRETIEYDAAGRVQRRTRLNPAGQANDQEEFEYDGHGNWNVHRVWDLDPASTVERIVLIPRFLERREIAYFD
jgi:YD repeat-containing protein